MSGVEAVAAKSWKDAETAEERFLTVEKRVAKVAKGCLCTCDKRETELNVRRYSMRGNLIEHV